MMRTATWIPILGVLCALSPTSAIGADPSGAPAGHWKLAGNADDSSPAGNHGTNHGADLKAAGPDGREAGAVAFDGRDDFIEVADGDTLRFGQGEFTISAWVNTDAQLDDALGDLVGRRKGFHLGFLHNVGVPSSQANYRQLQFGIDDGAIDKEWTDRGRPGNAVLIFALAVCNGELFAGTCEAGENEAGHVYRFDDRNGAWIDCGAPDRCNSVSALAVFEGKLYAGVSKYRLRGSALEESMNPHKGGRVYRYDGEQSWIDCGELAETEAIGGLVVYRGQLYASSLYAPAGFFRYEGDKTWTSCGTPGGKRVEALTVYNGFVFATGYDEGAVYRYDGEAWTHCGRLADNTQTYSFAVLNGQLHVGTWPSGKVYRYAGDNDWIDCGRLGNELEVMGMAAYNGKMYAGTLPLAEVYRYDGDNNWFLTGRVDHTPDVKYRRAWSMAVHDGQLFCGTLPSGHIHSVRAGIAATSGFELRPGWRHIAAVKGADRLRLYVDGKQVAESITFDAKRWDLANGEPLRIGAGPHDHFRGRMSDVRIYPAALRVDEIESLAGGRTE